MRRFLLLMTIALASVAACVGSDVAVTSGTPDAGDDSSGGGGDAHVGDDTSDSSPGDDASDAGDAHDATPRACTTGPTDASSRALSVRWTVNPPSGNQAVVSVGSISTLTCTILLEYIETTGGVPFWNVYLEKKDTTAGSCTEPKGFRTLIQTYAAPTAFIAKSALDPTLFVIAYDHKNTPSGGSPIQLSMEQVDWNTGDTLHAGGMAVIGSQPNIPPTPSGSPTALTATSCDVTLEGNNATFPGATGTNNNLGWVAHYTHFLAPEPQDPTGANDAAYK
jgi:hypothetical protein